MVVALIGLKKLDDECLSAGHASDFGPGPSLESAKNDPDPVGAWHTAR
jgi:hypothetical protein